MFAIIRNVMFVQTIRRNTIASIVCVLVTISAIFPARPASAAEVTYGIVTGTVYFTRLETIDIAGADVIAGAGFCAWVARKTGPAASVIGPYCAINAVSIISQARRAQNRNMCLKIKFTPTGLAWPDIY